MKNVLIVARWTVLEARRRKLLLAGVILSAAFVLLFTVGFTLLYHNIERSTQMQGQFGPGGFGGPSPREQLMVTSTIMVTLGLYGVQFLAGLLALFLGAA